MFFETELQRRELPRAGFIANQRHQCEGTEHNASSVLEKLVEPLSGELATKSRVLARLGMAHKRLYQLSHFERALCDQVKKNAQPQGFFQSVPKLEGQVHDLDALKQVAKHLFEIKAESLG